MPRVAAAFASARRLSFAGIVVIAVAFAATYAGAATPDLTVTKRHTGSFVVGGSGTYRITVINVGTASTASVTTVTDTLPAGLQFAGAVDSVGWTISGAGGVVTATRTAATVPSDSTFFAFNVNVQATAFPSVVNRAWVSVAGDPNHGNDFADDPTYISGPVDLALDKRHTEAFTVGQLATYTFVVHNIGFGSTYNWVTVIDTLPAGLSFVYTPEPFWTVTNDGQVVAANRFSAIAGGDSATFTMIVSVDAAAFPFVTNAATVYTTGDNNTSNDRDVDPTRVAGLGPDLAIEKFHTAPFEVGQVGTYTIVVRNTGTVPTSAVTTVADTLPAGLTYVSASGAGWSFSISGSIVTATHAAPIAVGGSTTLTISVAVSQAAFPSVTNAATVRCPGQVNPSNDRVFDPTTVNGVGPNLTIDKRHTGPFIIGQQAVYQFVVTNLGSVGTTNAISVVDSLPTGLSFVSGGGTGWAVSSIDSVVFATRTGPIAPGDSSALSVVVAVDAAALPSVTNSVVVSTMGDTDVDNDSDVDVAQVDAVVPTLVQSFTAEWASDGVRLSWRLAPGIPAAIAPQHAASVSGPWTTVEGAPDVAGEVRTVLDRDASPGVTSWYRLAGNIDGSAFASSAIAVEVPAAVAELAIRTSPNPTTGPLTIRFDVPRRMSVGIHLVDIQGRAVARIADAILTPGVHVWTADLRDSRSGLYFVRVQSEAGVRLQRVVLIR